MSDARQAKIAQQNMTAADLETRFANLERLVLALAETVATTIRQENRAD